MHKDVAEFLQQQFEKIKNKNSRFSIRAFAKKLDIPPSKVSELLSGKLKLSSYYADKISRSLKLNTEEAKKLKSLVSTSSRKTFNDYELLENELELMSSWHHFAILSLLKAKDFKPDSAWIASRLNVSETIIKDSLKLLKDINLIRVEGQTFRRNHNRLTTPVTVPSSAIKKALQQDLLKGLDMLEKTPLELRDYSTATMTVDIKNLPEAKREIAKFRNRMTKIMEKGSQEEVYNLCIQLFPLTVLNSK